MKFTYKEVIDLGFIRTDDPDKAFFDYNGYDYFLVTKEITENIALEWDSENHKVTLYYSDHNGSIIEKFEVKSRKKLVKFLKKTELVSSAENIKKFFKKEWKSKK